MKKVEILAPGGSREAIYAGIYCGADAVYTGTSRFSARAFADNPDVEELCRILDFAHLHDKKIYLTVNTLLSEEELEEGLYDMLRPLYEHGLDAVIVQDFGVLDFIREQFPGMELHASTQMTLLTAEGANLLKPYGVTRIVPARELTIEEIGDMRRKTDLEIEVFVHGALCYCYSGQCLMSKVIGGRSGNRGMCAQPCRLKYDVEGNKAGHYLSPKDLCTLEHVESLIQAGVDSFKIEGRMKKPAYTAYTSYLYRTYADACLSGVKPDDKEVKRDIARLADIYNRGGFSGGYLFETNQNNIIYTKKNGHYGVPVGEVTKVGKGTVEYRTVAETHDQDVLEFRDRNDERVYEYTVKEGAAPFEKVTARYKKGSPVKVGQKVYRTKNNQLLSEIEEKIQEGKKALKLKVRGVFYGICGEEVSLEVFYRDRMCRVTGLCAELAKGKPVAAEDIKKRLNKTGESQFEFEELEIRIDDNIFIPLGSLAALRREAFAGLEEQIQRDFARIAMPHRETQTEEVNPKEKFTVVQLTDFGQIQGVKSTGKVNPYNTRLHFKLEDFAPQEWKKLDEKAGDFQYYLSLPAVLRAKNSEKFLKLWEREGECFRNGNCAGILVHSIEALPVIERMNMGDRELIADTGMYVWNHRTEKMYREFGIIGHLYMAYGRTAVMTTEGCVNRELGGCQKDRTKRKHITIHTPKKDEFTVVNYCNYCYNVIYEKNPNWHEPEDIAHIPEIRFTVEGAEEVRKVLEQWNFL